MFYPLGENSEKIVGFAKLRKRELENKTGGNWGEEGGEACNHFFNGLLRYTSFWYAL